MEEIERFRVLTEKIRYLSSLTSNLNIINKKLVSNMIIKYLKFMKKWVIVYNSKAIAVGDSPYEVITEGFRVYEILHQARK